MNCISTGDELIIRNNLVYARALFIVSDKCTSSLHAEVIFHYCRLLFYPVR